MKPGYLTTEFWMVLLTMASTAWTSVSGHMPADIAGLVIGMSGVVYTAARAWVKGQHVKGLMMGVADLPGKDTP